MLNEIKEWEENTKIVNDNFKEIIKNIGVLLWKIFPDVRLLNFGEGAFWEKNIVDYHNHSIFIPLADIGKNYTVYTDKIKNKIGDCSKVAVIAIDGQNFYTENNGEKGIVIHYGWLNSDEKKSSHAD